MSEEPRDLYYHDHHFPFSNSSSPSSTTYNQQHGFLLESSSSMNFTEFLHGSTHDQYYNSLSTTFGLSPTSSHFQQQFSTPKDERNPLVDTPNSSAFSSSPDAGDDDQDLANNGKKEKQTKGMPEEEESSKKVNKQKNKKGDQKKQREPRFAFMTKSDVDQLEDGYRWRKYGQKAVKNSPYPRSYYRCTTQKCTVKKRVERSHEDPSVVVTTYEGQHNHHLPATLRGNVTAGLMYSSSIIHGGGGGSFPQHLLAQMPQLYNYGGGGGGGSMYQQPNAAALATLQQLQLPDSGLLQDMVNPTMSFKQEP